MHQRRILRLPFSHVFRSLKVQMPLASIVLALGSVFAVMLLAWTTVEEAVVDTSSYDGG